MANSTKRNPNTKEFKKTGSFSFEKHATFILGGFSDGVAASDTAEKLG